MSANYARQSTWVDGSGGGTPVSATRLNAIEAGIEAMDVALSAAIAAKAAAGAAPTAHAASHTSGGADAITVAQAQVTGLVAALAAKAANVTTINGQVGTTYTLVLGDQDGTVEMNNVAANTLTVPPNSGVAFPVGASIDVVQTGAGVTTIAPGAGVTINYYSPTSAGTRTIKAQWGAATLVKRATDTWVLIGNLT
jgi:hypothetical protein